MKTCRDIQFELIEKYKNNEFVIDRTGEKTVEIISANFLVSRDWLVRKPNYDYVEAEIKWYEKAIPNIAEIYNGEKMPPKAWIASSDGQGNINSNYGYLIWSEKYRNQYKNCLEELRRNPDSRRAIMVYIRPEIWVEYNENGKNDFICTLANQFFIRNGKLHSLYTLRSNDAIFGFNNDCAWAKYVQEELAADLKIEVGDLFWSVGSLHVYERHFEHLQNPVWE